MKNPSSKTWIMGKTDTITKNYMRNPEVFADAFNCFMYNGRQVIKADELNELDTTEISVLLGEDGKRFDKQVYRDILKYATLKKVCQEMSISPVSGKAINYCLSLRW